MSIYNFTYSLIFKLKMKKIRASSKMKEVKKSINIDSILKNNSNKCHLKDSKEILMVKNEPPTSNLLNNIERISHKSLIKNFKNKKLTLDFTNEI